MKALLAEQIDNTRRLIHGLRPTYLEELGLTTALEMLAQEQSADFFLFGTPTRLTPANELAFFRIAQEALANSTQHSQATKKQVTLSFEEGVLLIVKDNGIGFTLPAHPNRFVQQGHFGLLNIQERAQLMGGTLQIQTQPNQGTTVTVTLLNV